MRGEPHAAPWSASRRVCTLLLLGASLWPAAAQSDPPSPNSGPQRLKQDLRITVDTNAPPAGTIRPKEKRAFRVEASWLGWDGLHLELSQRTSLTNRTAPLIQFLGITNPVPLIDVEQVKMTATFGGRIEVDGTAFLTGGNLTGFDDGAQLRRALVSMQGDCILLMPVSYRVQLGFRANQFYLDEAYLLSPHISYIGDLQFGFFSPPMGLDLVTSSRDITFMEPAAPLQAIGPPKESGIQIGQPVLNQRATWSLGIFGDAATDSEYGNASRNYGSAIGRLTWLTLDHLDPDHPAANRYLHLGLSGSYQYSVTSDIRYKSRPESYLAPDVIDTGDIDASGAGTVDAEIAWVNGPFSLQGEFIHSFVQGTNSSLLNFGGFYAQASWYLTGESRPYDPATGAFARLIPRRNFNFGQGGAWGAVELACRISHADLTDGYIHGGRLNLLMAGVNWYLNPHVRWMFNYGTGRVFDGPQDGHMVIFQTRIGVDF